MNWEQFKTNLAEVGYMQAELKRRAMMFQAEIKESKAKELGLPLWAFYHMPYKDLGILKDPVAAVAWFEANRKDLERQERNSYMQAHAGFDWREKLVAHLREKLAGDIPVEKRTEYEQMLKEIEDE